jgi:hypothetical protein
MHVFGPLVPYFSHRWLRIRRGKALVPALDPAFRGDVLLRHPLLRQPGGFEGRCSVLAEVATTKSPASINSLGSYVGQPSQVSLGD